MTLLELVATAFGLTCVWLTIRRNVWCWPTGLVQVILYAWIFYQARLYSDVLLHVVYIGLQVYGWHHWVRGGSRHGAVVADGPVAGALPITRLSAKSAAAWVGVGAVGTAALGFIMDRWAGAALPYWDAGIAAFSLVAQYLLARKVLENWLFWVAVDAVAIGVYRAKGLHVTTGLYAVFLGMAVSGWFAWRRSFRCQAGHHRDFVGTTPVPAGVGDSCSASSSRLTAGTSS